MTQIGPGGIIRVGDPRQAVAPSPVKHDRFVLKINEVQLEDIRPNGDRYTVEVIDLDEKIELGQILVVTQDPSVNPRDPAGNPQVEQRGVLTAVVVRAGNGHLLGLPDQRIAVKNLAGVVEVERHPADVPCFYAPGDVVFVDRNAKGRALRILGREGRIVNQIDILAGLEEKGKQLRLARVDGTWVREEQTAEG